MPRTVTSLQVSVLALLTERPMHPYEMYQLLVSRAQDRLVKVRPGSLYHAVDRLEAAGLVCAVGTDRDGNRPERTTYDITEAGRLGLTARVTEMLQSPAAEYREFPLAVSEAHNLSRDAVVGLLQIRMARLQSELQFFRSGQELARRREVPRRFWLELSYQQAILQAQLDWVAALVDDLETGRLEW